MYILSHTTFSLFVSTNTFLVFTAQDKNQNLVQEKDFQFHKNKYTTNKPQQISCQKTDLLPTREDKHYSDVCAHNCFQILNTEEENCI